jgi:hypothetical protein
LLWVEAYAATAAHSLPLKRGGSGGDHSFSQLVAQSGFARQSRSGKARVAYQLFIDPRRHGRRKRLSIDPEQSANVLLIAKEISGLFDQQAYASAKTVSQVRISYCQMRYNFCGGCCVGRTTDWNIAQGCDLAGKTIFVICNQVIESLGAIGRKL